MAETATMLNLEQVTKSRHASALTRHAIQDKWTEEGQAHIKDVDGSVINQ